MIEYFIEIEYRERWNYESELHHKKRIITANSAISAFDILVGEIKKSLPEFHKVSEQEIKLIDIRKI